MLSLTNLHLSLFSKSIFLFIYTTTSFETFIFLLTSSQLLHYLDYFQGVGSSETLGCVPEFIIPFSQFGNTRERKGRGGGYYGALEFLPFWGP